ncbi:SGNH/GDSL hydrolase family protein [Neobacillus sp. SAB-20_R2A]|uniref:SGNH/GDSL hydrolase family protein n=1 Tax=Neobacillus sp. SAB-20_R2A TaxID=3120519 RepID=UPI003C6E9CE8
MQFKRFSVLFAFILTFSSFFSSFAFAESNVKPSLVALGDSITYGWNLDDTNGNTNQSSKAFPYLIGNGDYRVSANISGGGWTSGKLLNEISKPENILAIKNADVITIDIGSNDYLQNELIQKLRAGQPVDPVQLPIAIGQVTKQLSINLGAIIGTIRAYNQDAPIILYNIYNPFWDTNAALYPLGEQFLPIANGAIQQVATASKSLLADSYTAFKGKQSDYIFPGGDIHPNEAGQQVLAGLATSLLSALPKGEITIDLTASTTEPTSDSVTITVSTSAKKALAIQWLKGDKTVEDFAKVGTGVDIKEKKFQVTTNGTYTVYIRDAKGAMAVKSITISNIRKGWGIGNGHSNINMNNQHQTLNK